MSATRNKRPMLTKVWAKNFHSLENVSLDLGPLTVFVGPNASGKSNIVDVLSFVADAGRDGLDAAIMKRHGIGAIRRWSAQGRPYDVEIGVCVEGLSWSLTYEFTLGGEARSEYRVKKDRLRVSGGSGGGLKAWEFEIEARDGKIVNPQPPDGLPSERWPVPDAAGLLLYSMLRGPFLFWIVPDVLQKREVVFDALVGGYQHLTDMRFYHIFPNAFRDPQKPGDPDSLGEHGENLASVVRQMRKRPSPLLLELVHALGKVVPGVTDLQANLVGGYLVVKLKHERAAGNGKGAWFDLSQESDGTLRLLALLVALFRDRAPSLIAIEEPELTIHPGALAVLADLLQEQATARSQVLITTHSPDLIDRFSPDSLRAVRLVNGATEVGPVAPHQAAAVKQRLFSTGELHRMEGLEPARPAS